MVGSIAIDLLLMPVSDVQCRIGELQRTSLPVARLQATPRFQITAHGGLRLPVCSAVQARGDRSLGHGSHLTESPSQVLELRKCHPEYAGRNWISKSRLYMVDYLVFNNL